MKIIFSPAKKMNSRTEIFDIMGLPRYLEASEEILCWLQERSLEELQKLWGCSEKISLQNYVRTQEMNVREGLTPAVMAYEGIAYQYMAPVVFEREQLSYVQEHLRILSGFYGVLKAMDGVTPYRLEMQARVGIGNSKDLYEFWGKRIYDAVCDESRIIINLASKEYSKCVEKYLQTEDRFITITFCEQVGGRLITKGTYAKMARGEMVRFMAENQIEEPGEIKKFNRLCYHFREDISDESEYVFERIGERENEGN